MKNIIRIFKKTLILGIWLIASSHCYAAFNERLNAPSEKRSHHCCPNSNNNQKDSSKSCAECGLCFKVPVNPEIKLLSDTLHIVSENLKLLSANIYLQSTDNFIALIRLLDNIDNYTISYKRFKSSLIDSPNAPPL